LQGRGVMTGSNPVMVVRPSPSFTRRFAEFPLTCSCYLTSIFQEDPWIILVANVCLRVYT
jgi:hypothetical protein